MKSWWKICTISALTVGSFSIALSALADKGKISITEILSDPQDGAEVRIYGTVIEQQPGEDEYIISDETGEITVEIDDLNMELDPGTKIEVLGVVSLELEHKGEAEKEGDPTPEEIEIEATEVNIMN